MPNELLLKIGGIFHLVCALFHIVFPKMFNWNENLSELSAKKSLIIKQNLHIMNICLLLFWLIFAIVPFFFSSELLTTSIGKMILILIITFWIIRIFIFQPIFVGIKTKESWQMIIFFLVGFIFFIIPCLSIM
jgi:hypothetical protein